MEELLEIIVGEEKKKVPPGTTYEALAREFSFPHAVFLAKQGNRLKELTSTIKTGGAITFLDLGDPDAMRVYHRSVSFLMIRAIKCMLGDTAKVQIQHSLHKSLYCEIPEAKVAINEAFLAELDSIMRRMVAEDLPIVKETFAREEAIAIARRFGMEDKAQLFHYRRASNINLYELDGFYDYFYGYMTPSTGYLKLFQLMPYEKGFLIRFPDKENPEQILPFHDPSKISAVFLEQMEWCRLMGVDQVADLNQIICNDAFGDLVRINEALHEKKVAEIADQIYHRIDKVKVVLIAGPSSSGKTTFANRLCVQLRVLGVQPHTISLDDYFINRDDVPVDACGNKDFESIHTLDLPLFNSDLTRLIQGEAVEIPYYNFVTGKREYNGNVKQLHEGEIFVIEGIHGLNDTLTASIPEESKFKIFISAMTRLNIDDHNRISTSDSRLIRRIVRDHQFRGRDACGTIQSWQSVTRGEEHNIFPFQEKADVIFNSATIYELSVLKQYVEPMLFQITPDMPEYIDAKRLIKFLDYFLGANGDDIPKNSILKEFLGGSSFKV